MAWDFSPLGISGIGVYRSCDEVRSFIEDDWFETFPFEEWEIEVDELIDLGDQVLVMCRQRGRGATSGVGAELEQAHIFTLRDGEIVRAASYLEHSPPHRRLARPRPQAA